MGQMPQSRVVAKCGAFGPSTIREYEPDGAAGLDIFELFFQTRDVTLMFAREGDGPHQIKLRDAKQMAHSVDLSM